MQYKAPSGPSLAYGPDANDSENITCGGIICPLADTHALTVI